MHHCSILSCRSQSIYRLKKACHGELDEDCNLLTPDQVVDRIFELVDENGDGECFEQQKVKGQGDVFMCPLLVHDELYNGEKFRNLW